MNLKDFPIPSDTNNKAFRKFAGKVCRYEQIKKETIIELYEIQTGIKNSTSIVQFMLNNQLITKEGNNYSPTINLSAIYGASLNTRKKLSPAWDEVAQALVRTIAINQTSDEWNSWMPTGFYLFGSLLDVNKQDFGDADIIITKTCTPQLKEMFQQKRNWAKRNIKYVSSQAVSVFGFECESQTSIDIKKSRSFLSFHPDRTASGLYEEDKNFPILKLWESSKQDKEKIETKAINEIQEKWQNANIEKTKLILMQLDLSLSKLNLDRNSPNFEIKCKEYFIKEIANDLCKEFDKLIGKEEMLTQSDSIFDFNLKNLGRVVRLGYDGAKSLGHFARLKNCDFSNPSMLSVFINKVESVDDIKKWKEMLIQGWNDADKEIRLNHCNKTIEKIKKLQLPEGGRLKL